ncbi:molybdopterin oxidoreductase family protein [Streptomyces sp. RerS4]|uniref:molybdopterin oxidoreductase family protein n=1 Tax=Streptomyces sp. RerS4 TaxID=2942449 RepID=UPI00201C5CB7|nr:molybdopterin oxidoreductase family protein [Streptomyces sp. RerS4]UQW99961.1 molybdopterin oxidoreductase family protein [Streptomyces sp. RerS4]
MSVELTDTADTAEAATHCAYCALQCATVLRREGAEVTVRPADPAEGGLCRKGWTAPEVLRAPDRLRTPLLRGADGRLAPTDWDTALDFVADRLRALRAEHGADAVAVFGSGGLTNEKAYQLGKFARVALGTSRIDYNGRFCMSSAAAAGNAAFGLDRGLPFPTADLGRADVIMLAGANPAETMPPLMRHLTRADLIVIDPRRTRTAELAALHLQPVPGTDLALALGLFHLAVTENLLDKSYVDRRTSGFDEAWQRALPWWPERVEAITGVPVADMRRAVTMLAEAGRRYVLTGRGAEQHSKGTDTVAAFVNLSLALGLPGREGSGYGCLTGQGNGQGGREHGQKADQLPGYRMITDPAARAHVAGVWGVDPDTLPGPGLDAYRLLDSLGTPGGPKAMLVFGSNPAVSAPRAGHIGDRLAALDLLVVADFVPSETAVMADVVLPVTQWAEEEGTLTNMEGRVLRRRPVLAPPPGVRTDLEVLHGLAVRLGQDPARFPTAPRTVFEELRRASAGGRADYAGVSYERLDAGEELHWPCPAPDASGAAHPGTPRMFLDRFAHPDGRARFAAVEYRESAEAPDDALPLYATTGRVLAHYQSGAQTRRVPELAAAAPEAFVEVHPDTARRHGLVEGALARVVSVRGAVVARVRCAPDLRTDTVFLPFHFPGAGRANLVTGSARDPVSGMPEFKLAAVRVEPWQEAS